ncbi:baseplate J/gp47 family protein [Formicincola oecophyllae]|uniref:Baseplate J/gp47 family protein n=1 Tax=Formicincola oecophyllae TaxID=2558361 RepID=A0A4Y6U8M5_9PROT|nr:baseplate J/gp47 family protein [Formicincola oecophyllae]QDH13803.1 baseplate J/gp47 family protein [Formicincola oecophyllae]
MSANIPSPQELAQRFAASLAQATFMTPDGQMVQLDPTAPGTLEQVLAAVHGLADYETYLFMRDRLLEMLPTTATAGTDGLLEQHGEIWGVPRRSPLAALGRVVFTASQAVTVPAGTLLVTDGTVQWSVNEAVLVPAGGTAVADVTCTVVGTAGNLAGGSPLSLVSPIPGVTAVTADADGLAGGAGLEDVESWRARIIEAIRSPYNGGDAADYVRWAENAGASYVNVVPELMGLGTVGVVIAFGASGEMPSTATPDEVARVQSYIDNVRPIRGNVQVFPASIVPQNPSLALQPDTQAARQAVTAALSALYLSVGIGGTLYLESVQAAIVAAAGSKNTLIYPNSTQVFTPDEMPVLGTISWQTLS